MCSEFQNTYNITKVDYETAGFQVMGDGSISIDTTNPKAVHALRSVAKNVREMASAKRWIAYPIQMAPKALSHNKFEADLLALLEEHFSEAMTGNIKRCCTRVVVTPGQVDYEVLDTSTNPPHTFVLWTAYT
jgi:hypothetical protein